MSSFLGNAISKLYNAVSAPVAATQDALAERLQSAREIVSLQYNRIMENMRYGWKRLKNIIEKKQKKKKPKSNSKNQQQQKEKKKSKINSKD